MIKISQYNEYTDEEYLNMSKKRATEGLSEKHQRWCEEYVRCHNVRIANIKADLKSGHLIRKRPEAQRYIQWLKAHILQSVFIDAADILEHHIRIAFADISDFVEIRPNSIRLKPEDQIDGQLVKSIKSGRDGVSIELYDKLKSLDFLAKYCDDMPKDWKQKIEEKRLELQEQEFELKKKTLDFSGDEVPDDGLIQAIKDAAKVVWEE